MGMRDIFLEYYGNGVAVYRPGTSIVAATKESFDEALAYALVEWPDGEIRVKVSQDMRALLAAFPPRCPRCG
jgi:hypothetical protein